MNLTHTQSLIRRYNGLREQNRGKEEERNTVSLVVSVSRVKVVGSRVRGREGGRSVTVAA